MSTAKDTLGRRIATMEAKIAARRSKRNPEKSSSDDLMGEIEALERKAGFWMDDDAGTSDCGESGMGSYMEDEIVLDDDSGMGYMEDEIVLDDDSGMGYMGDEIVLDDDDDDDDDDIDFDDVEEDIFLASEDKPGIEDEITQDYLNDVVEERGKEGLATEPSMLDAAPTGYVARLKSASARLDRVATHLEKQGRKKMAYRVDTIADAIDARIAKEVGDE